MLGFTLPSLLSEAGGSVDGLQARGAEGCADGPIFPRAGGLAGVQAAGVRGARGQLLALEQQAAAPPQHMRAKHQSPRWGSYHSAEEAFTAFLEVIKVIISN